MPTLEGYSPSIKGEVNNKNAGVNVIIGVTSDISEIFMAFKNRIVLKNIVNTPKNKDIQNILLSSGISMKNNAGSKKMKINIFEAKATKYSSIFSRLFLLKTLLKESKNADKNASISHIIFL
jgi:hypothetical protein